MSIKEALKEAIALLDGVEVKGKTNMKRHVMGIERIESVVTALEHAEKEEVAHEDHHDEKRENA